MSHATFHLKNVRRRLSDAFQLQIGDLTVERREVFALLGPTGSGKTTLLRILTGLEIPDDGIIEFNGTLLNRSTPLSVVRRIAMVHQRPILINGSVAGNIAYGLRTRSLASDAKVAQILQRLGLDRLIRQDARSLSGGQVQLVALARALVLEPEVLLLDEPSANLDPAYVALVESVIREARMSREMTVIWATHNLFQARRVCDRVMLMLNGSIVEIGDNETFFASPSDSRTAAFIEGKMVY